MQEGIGLYVISIREAAELLCKDAWYEGKLPSVVMPDDFEGADDDVRLQAALTPSIAKCQARLLRSVASGILQCRELHCNSETDEIDAERTQVSLHSIESWLYERGLAPGDHFNEAQDLELEMEEHLKLQVAGYRRARRIGQKSARDFLALARGATEGQETAAYFQRLRHDVLVVAEEQKLRLSQMPVVNVNKLDLPPHPKARRSLFIVIAALCKKANIQIQAQASETNDEALHRNRDATSLVQKYVDQAGLSLDEKTIRSLLTDVIALWAVQAPQG